MMGEKVGAVDRARPATRLDVDGGRSPTPASGSPTSRCRSTSSFRAEPLPRNPGGKVLKGSLRKDTEWGDPIR